MKTIILAVALFLSTLCGCSQKKGYVINAGNMYGTGEDPLYLVVRQGDKQDTIARTKMQQGGKFRFEGQVDGVVLADIRYQGNRIYSFFLENKEYSIDMRMGGTPVVSGGGHDQQVKQQFDNIAIKHEKTINGIAQYYQPIEATGDSSLLATFYDAFHTTQKLIAQEENLFIATHPDEMVSAYVTHQSIGKVPDETVKLRYDLLGSKAKATSYGREIADYIRTCVGTIVPDFSMDTPDGKSLNLYDLQGKVKIIDFWASWCPACRAETPRLSGMYKKYHEQGLEILSVTLDEDKKAWKKAMEKDGMNWKNGFCAGAFESVPARQYMIQVIPFIVVLDADNRVVAKGLIGEKLQEKIEELMNE